MLEQDVGGDSPVVPGISGGEYDCLSENVRSGRWPSVKF